MKTVAFYSFKGGVGRTSALLNVAYLMAAKADASVVVADWDVHAPGLTCLYDLQPPDGPRLSPGVVDVLASLAEASPEGEVLDPADLVHPTRLGRRIADAGGGDVWLVPAGAFDPADEGSSYRATVQRLQPKIQGLAAAGKRDLVSWFADRVGAGFAERAKKPLDFLLLDARTGLTEVGDLLLSEATDQVVVLFGLNAQNQLGMEQVLRELVHGFGPANVAARVVLVASPVPAGEEELKARRLREARQTIERVVDELTRKASEGDRNPIVPAAPRLLTVPYHPLIALDEALISEQYPESDPGRAYARIDEAIRGRGRAALVETKAAAVRAIEQVNEAETPALRGVPTGEHPFARLLPWNVVLPEAEPERLAGTAGALAGPILEGLANSVSLSETEKARILDSLPKLGIKQLEELHRIFGEEQRQWREIGPAIWPRLAELAGRNWIEWANLSARRLGVDVREGVRRLLERWPLRFEGETGVRAALAALDALRATDALSEDALSALLSPIVEQNSEYDLALAGAASLMVEAKVDADRAAVLFERARAVVPSASSFSTALLLQYAGSRLSSADRAEEAVLLWSQAGQHYERALAAEPDKHEAENNWGNVLNDQAKTLASRDLDRALELWDRAGEHYSRALGLKPDLPYAENNWGSALDDQAKALVSRDLDRALELWDRAGEHYSRALGLKPDLHGAEYNWGSALDDQAKALVSRDLDRALELWDRAGEHYSRALILKSDLHEAENNWGIALDDQAKALVSRDLDRALELWGRAGEHYSRALGLKSDKHEAENNWGIALDNQAKALASRDLDRALELWDRAGEHYSRALRLKSDKHEAEHNWGIALANQAKALVSRDLNRALDLWDRAGEHYSRALGLKPDKHEAENNWVTVESHRHHALKRAGRDSAAQAAAARALAHARRHQEMTGRLSYNLACAMGLNGHTEEALDTLEALHRSMTLGVEAAHMASDPDLTSLAEHPRFKALLETLRTSTASPQRS